MYCKVTNEALRTLIEETAMASGRNAMVNSGLGPKFHSDYFLIRDDGDLSAGNFDCASKYGDAVSAEQLLDELAKPKQPKITVNGHTVGFPKGSVRIGCTTIDAETVEAIYKRFKEQQ